MVAPVGPQPNGGPPDGAPPMQRNPQAPGGVGNTPSNITPPNAPPPADLIAEIVGWVKWAFVTLHDLLFVCFPEHQKEPVELQARSEMIPKLLDKWFPNKLTLYKTHNKETLIADFQGLDPEDFKAIVRAFDNSIDEAISAADFVGDHVMNLKKPKELKIEGKPHLIRPFGLNSSDLATDIDNLPKKVRENLIQRVAAAEEELPKDANAFAEWISGNAETRMGILKFQLEALSAAPV